MITTELMAREHQITVTRTQVRVFVECSCGRERRFDSQRAANRDALTHLHETAGCTCPPDVRDLDVHPKVPGPGSPAPVAVTTPLAS